MNTTIVAMVVRAFTKPGEGEREEGKGGGRIVGAIRGSMLNVLHTIATYKYTFTTLATVFKPKATTTSLLIKAMATL